MFRLIVTLMMTWLFSTLTFAAEGGQHQRHVIYFTWDGVRWQDVFLNRTTLPIFWSKYAKQAEIYGAPHSSRTMEVASVPVSLPSYQSQMSGRVQIGACSDNECGRIKEETFPEVLVNQFKFKKKEIATISSWEVTDNAVEHIAGTTFTNDGTRPLTDPDTHIADRVMAEINQQQAANYPGDDTRLDKYTFAHALHYFEKYQPAFMWISFGDSDEYAHAGDRAGYEASLAYYDKALDELMTLLNTLHLAQDTMIIVTTDHGRGNGENWRDHGEEYPESKQTWAFVLNGELAGGIREGQLTHYSTLSIRPTVERALTGV